MTGAPTSQVDRAIAVGVASGLIVGLLRLAPWYRIVVEPLLALLGVSATELTTEALTALAEADARTKAEGWRYVFDNNNPARPPRLVKRRVV